jgi:trehalose-6-phosphate synthase
MHQSISIHLLTALYYIADVCIVTSSRDGMNLVAIEYMFVKSFGEGGALVISEFAGASRIFKTAKLINPWDIKTTAKNIAEALMLSQSKSVSQHEIVDQYSAKNWASRFMEDMGFISSQESFQNL